VEPQKLLREIQSKFLAKMKLLWGLNPRKEVIPSLIVGEDDMIDRDAEIKSAVDVEL